MGRELYSYYYIAIGHLIGIIIAPYFKLANYFRPSHKLDEINVKVILVNEYHRIGDVLLIEPILRSLKSKFPEADIILICNKKIEQLAKHLSLADTIIGIEAPWTNWNWSIKKWKYLYTFFSKDIKSKNIDLAFDFKGDIRNSFFLWSTKPKKSYGYSFTGGKYFFTNPQNINIKMHQQKRAFHLVKKVGCIEMPIPNKSIQLDGTIVIHPGASDIKRAWSEVYWFELIKLLAINHDISIVKIAASKDLLEKINNNNIKIKIFKGSLVEFNEWLINQKLIIAPDSMAGHLAAYNGIPSISIFGSQDPELTYPSGSKSKIIKPKISCSHKKVHWRLCEKCMLSIKPIVVYKEAIKFISEIKNKA